LKQRHYDILVSVPNEARAMTQSDSGARLVSL
jgi:hypothetical protein